MNQIIVGVDVSKDESHFFISLPDGKPHSKAFVVEHTQAQLFKALNKIKKVESELNVTTTLVLESTGHYHQPIINFFRMHQIEVIELNPIQVHSIKNIYIRKAKTDKLDAAKIALFYRLNLAKVSTRDKQYQELKALCRFHQDLMKQVSQTTLRSQAIIDQTFPRFRKVFPKIQAKGALFILENYSTPLDILNADKPYLVDSIRKISRIGLDKARKKVEALYEVAADVQCFATYSETLIVILLSNLKNIQSLNQQADTIQKKIEALVKDTLEFKLLCSFPGISTLSAATILAEIQDFSAFDSPDKLVAFCGLDPRVFQSGTFNASHNKISKRGSPHLRRALFYAARVSISSPSGKTINPVLRAFYSKKCETKPKMVALVAVMRKLVLYIFAVIRNGKPYQMTTPEEHSLTYKTLQQVA